MVETIRRDAPATTHRSPQRSSGWRPLLVTAIAFKAASLLLWLAHAPLVLVALAFFAPDPFLFHAIVAPSASGLCRVRTRFVTEQPEVWLTIDDGPDEHDTPRLLEVLERHGARATFFVVGERAARFPDLITRILEAGHTIAHHTHTHPAWTFWAAGPRRVARELDAGLAVLAAHGVRPTYFRSPVGLKPLLLGPVLASRNLEYVGWSVRSHDCRCRSVDEVARRAEGLQPGAILLVHEGATVPPAVRVAGIARLLEEIAARDLRCVIPKPDQLR